MGRRKSYVYAGQICARSLHTWRHVRTLAECILVKEAERHCTYFSLRYRSVIEVL